MRRDQVQREVLRSFLGEGQAEPYRKGQVITVNATRAEQYDAQKLTGEPKARPTKAQAAAASESHKKQLAAAETKKAAGPAENKGAKK